MLSLSPELFAAAFLLLALNNIFKEIEFKVQRDEIVFNIGFYLGIASLFVFSYSIFLIGVQVILFVFARLSIRKSLLLTFGFAFPHLAVICLYYFRGGLPELMKYFYDANFTLQSVNLVSWKSIFWLSGGILLFFFFSVIMLNREARFTKYQSQLLQVMLLWMLISFIEVGITRELSPHCLMPFVPPLTYFISHYLLLIRRKWIAEAMAWIFLFSTIGISTAARLNRIPSIEYKKLFVENSKYSSFLHKKRIFLLGNDWGIYKSNQAASCFLNWNLSKEVFEQPDYFENVILVQQSFEKDMPDIIIDEERRMENFFKRLPSLKASYEKAGFIFIKKPDHQR